MEGNEFMSTYGQHTPPEPPSMPLSQIAAGLQAASEPKWKAAMVDLSLDVPEPIALIKWGDSIIFSRSNISTIGGRAKSRKTFLIVRLAADFLESCYGKVLIIDTEMARFHTYKTARRIHKILDWDTKQNNERLTVLTLRERDYTERVEIFEEAIQQIKPDIVFTDGVRDFVKDINNADESSMMVNKLMKLSTEYDCHICCVLHENDNNGKLRGHLGTEILNKSETVLKVVKNDIVSTVVPAACRNVPFDARSFQVNADGLPEYCDTPAVTAKIDALRELFAKLLPNGTALSHGALSDKITQAGEGRSTKARNKIRDALQSGIIIKNQVGQYYFSRYDTGDDDSLL